MSEPVVTVAPGTTGDKPVFRNLLQLYRYDMSTFDHRELDSHGLFDYAYLDQYWTPEGQEAGRRPFLITANGRLAGFVLKAEHSHLGRVGGAHNFAEFFIVRRWRRRGLGRQVAVAIFDQFPGNWEIAQMCANVDAQAFWRAVVHGYSNGAFKEIGSRPPAWDGPFSALPRGAANRPAAFTATARPQPSDRLVRWLGC